MDDQKDSQINSPSSTQTTLPNNTESNPAVDDFDIPSHVPVVDIMDMENEDVGEIASMVPPGSVISSAINSSTPVSKTISIPKPQSTEFKLEPKSSSAPTLAPLPTPEIKVVPQANQVPVAPAIQTTPEISSSSVIPSGIPEDASTGMLDSKEVEIQNPAEQVPDIDIPTLRTYKSDISQTVNKDKISTAKILIAEQNRNKQEQIKNFDTSIKRPTNIIVLLISIVLIVSAVGALGYFGYTKITANKVDFVPTVAPTTFLFVFDNQKYINAETDVFDLENNLDSISKEAESFENRTYTDVIFYKTDSETKENSRITALEFFSKFDIDLPTNIARSIGRDFVYGLYTENGKTEPFLVVSIIDYEIAYSSIFTWESTLALDIRSLFPNLKDLFDISKNKMIPPLDNPIIANATTTNATSTEIATTTASTTITSTSTEPELSPEEQIEKQIEMRNVINRNIRFLDIVFSNKDARTVRDSNGTPFFYYSFIDKTKIIFAQKPELLSEITRKMKEKSLVR